MRMNKWTVGLAAAGLVSLPGVNLAEEQPSPILTALSSTTISGYVNVSAWWNPGTGNANNPAIPFGPAFGENKTDGFNLDVVKVALERPLDEASWAAGYKAELLFGPDANGLATTSSGFGISDFGIKQAYVAVRTPLLPNGLDFKFGVWDTIIGYESFDAGNNPNYTRSYGYAIEPTTHTGLLATYQLLESVALAAGIANTFGPTINQKAHSFGRSESYKTYMASIALTAPEDFGFLEGATAYAGVINGFNGGIVGGATQTSWYLGATIPTPIEGFRFGASYDYLGTSGRDAFFAGREADSAYANAIALYASFQATEKLSVHARGEYASSDIPVRVAPDGSLVPLLGAKKVIEATGTIQYDLWKNVLSRLEVRWDHAADGSAAFGGDTLDVPTKKNAYLIAANLIYKF